MARAGIEARARSQPSGWCVPTVRSSSRSTTTPATTGRSSSRRTGADTVQRAEHREAGRESLHAHASGLCRRHDLVARRGVGALRLRGRLRRDERSAAAGDGRENRGLRARSICPKTACRGTTSTTKACTSAIATRSAAALIAGGLLAAVRVDAGQDARSELSREGERITQSLIDRYLTPVSRQRPDAAGRAASRLEHAAQRRAAGLRQLLFARRPCCGSKADIRRMSYKTQ